ncbi:MAG: ACT domain-containing protein [Massiliimalia sp.]|jgi:chorismate mutase
MEKDSQMILVDSSVLPVVFLKVLKAKKLLAKGLARNSSDACKTADISRSAFYKYKDKVFLYEDKDAQKTVTLYFRLSDEPGVLSSVLGELYRHSANILTVNQNIPIEGVADVTITVRIDANHADLRGLKTDFEQIPGIVEFRRI